jgi:NAD(P)-dependent dehydrogenase (short-subunit alcohol dehydrogenase family)
MKNEGRYAAYGLAGRVAMVTGGSKNIGRHIVSVLAEAGAVPVILYREDEETARKVCAEIEKNGGRAGMVQADMADVTALRQAVRRVESDFGGVDILVNNAAVRPNTKITAVSVEEWDRVLDTNLRGPFFLSQAVLPGMVRRKWGRIINIGGVDAYWGKTRRPHNVAAKLGLVGLTRSPTKSRATASPSTWWCPAPPTPTATPRSGTRNWTGCTTSARSARPWRAWARRARSPMPAYFSPASLPATPRRRSFSSPAAHFRWCARPRRSIRPSSSGMCEPQRE